MQQDYVSRWKGDTVKPFPLLKNVDFEDIPPELHAMWYKFHLQTTCAECRGDYSAIDALRFGPECNGRYHRPASFQRFDEYAVVPLAFVYKTGISLPEDAICIDTFEKAQEWLTLRSSADTKFETAADIATQLDIPQPLVTEAVQVALNDMMSYIQNSDEQVEQTANPWQPIVFIRLF